jgi:predicted regulator of Ras-like GTPase activity (Roadblock/LC7/MglB family)
MEEISPKALKEIEETLELSLSWAKQLQTAVVLTADGVLLTGTCRAGCDKEKLAAMASAAAAMGDAAVRETEESECRRIIIEGDNCKVLVMSLMGDEDYIGAFGLFCARRSQ